MEAILARLMEIERRLAKFWDALMALSRHLRAVEQRLRELPDAPVNSGQNSGGGGANFIPAMTGGGGIPAFSGSTLGSATVTLYTILATGGVPTWTATTQTVTALNQSSTAVGASKRIGLASDGTNWICVWEDC